MREVIVALSTPFTNGKINADELVNHIKSLVRAGVDGFFLMGTTGLGIILTNEEKREVMRIAKEAAGRKRLIAHVGAAVIDDAVAIARDAAKLGMDAIASVPPIYYKPDAAALSKYYDRLSKAAGLPIYIYNIPQNSGFNVTPTHAGLLKNTVMGIKDSTGDIGQVADFVGLGLEVFNGADHAILPALVVGAKGAVSAMANVVPELEIELMRRYEEGKINEAMNIQRTITRIRDAVKNYPTPAAYYWAATVVRGYELGGVKEPLRDLTEDEKGNLRRDIEKIMQNIKN